MLEAAAYAFARAWAAGAMLDEADKTLTAAEKTVGAPEEVAKEIKDIARYTPPRAKDLGMDGKKQDFDVEGLEYGLNDIAEMATEAAQDYTFKAEELKGLEETLAADVVSKGSHLAETLLKVAKMAVDAAKAFAKKDPYSGAKAGLEALELILGYAPDPLFPEAIRKMGSIADAQKKLKDAAEKEEKLKQRATHLKERLDELQALGDETWGTAEDIYDNDKENRGKFRFSKLEAAIVAAGQKEAAAFHAARTAEGASRATADLEELRLTDRIVRDMRDTTTKMFVHATREQRDTEKIHAEYLQLRELARDAMATANKQFSPCNRRRMARGRDNMTDGLTPPILFAGCLHHP